MTNENRIIELMTAFNNPMCNAIFWERVLKMADMTIDAYIENPQSFDTPFVHGSAFKQWADKVIEINELQQPVNSVVYYLFMYDDSAQLYDSFIQHKEYINLADCVKDMQQAGMPMCLYTHELHDNPSLLLNECIEFTRYVILEDDEVELLRKEGLL